MDVVRSYGHDIPMSDVGSDSGSDSIQQHHLPIFQMNCWINIWISQVNYTSRCDFVRYGESHACIWPDACAPTRTFLIGSCIQSKSNKNRCTPFGIVVKRMLIATLSPALVQSLRPAIFAMACIIFCDQNPSHMLWLISQIQKIVTMQLSYFAQLG
jgi:hypothetical protein